jgi:hypothetical protein
MNKVDPARAGREQPRLALSEPEQSEPSLSKSEQSGAEIEPVQYYAKMN